MNLVEKDLGYFVKTAAEAGFRAELAEAGRARYAQTSADGHGGDNIVGVARRVGLMPQ